MSRYAGAHGDRHRDPHIADLVRQTGEHSGPVRGRHKARSDTQRAGAGTVRTARTSNQSILKEISPGCSLEGLMLKLKLQYFGHLMRRTDLLKKTLILGKIEGGMRRG